MFLLHVTAPRCPVPSSCALNSCRTPSVFSSSTFVSTQRKPEEESPVKDTDAKQAKQEATVNGSGDSSASKGVQEGKSQEASDRLVLRLQYIMVERIPKLV